jgi:hypothetical protein
MRLLNWLGRRPESGAEAEIDQILDQGLEAMRHEAPPPSAAEGVWGRVEPALRTWPQERRQRLPRGRPVLALGALLATLATAGFWHHQANAPRPVPHHELTWIPEAGQPDSWIDDPAGETMERVWSGLEDSGKR